MKAAARTPFPLLLALGLLAAAPASARPPAQEGAASRQAPAAERGISLEEAVSRLRRHTGGRVLSAEPRDGEYRVRILTPDGRVKRYRVDRRSGRVR